MTDTNRMIKGSLPVNISGWALLDFGRMDIRFSSSANQETLLRKSSLLA